MGTEDARGRLVDFALGRDAPEALQVEGLQTLSGWTGSSEFDRITGMYRGAVANDRAAPLAALDPLIEELAASPDYSSRPPLTTA